MFPEVIYIDDTYENGEIELALQYNDSYTDTVYAFANNINTVEGGTHLEGFKASLTKIINDYAKRPTSSRATKNFPAKTSEKASLPFCRSN